MQIELTPTLERLIAEKVETGLYRDASDVVRAALRLLAFRDNDEGERRVELEAAIAQGRQGFAEGRYQVFETEDEIKGLFERL
jgi:antitoxin ParD1/3/4